MVYINNGWNCVNIASFYTGHEDLIYNNTCIVSTSEKVDDLFDNCGVPSPGQAMMHGFNNRFYTPLGQAGASCDDGKPLIPLAKLWPGLEDNFTASTLPSAATIVAWGKEKLGL